MRKPLFKGMKGNLRLKLLNVRTFASGNVLLYYEPERIGVIESRRGPISSFGS
jgi:hypothetical protein